MVSEDLPALIFTSMIIIFFIIMMFYVLQDYVSKSGEAYIYRTALTILHQGTYGKSFVNLTEYESEEISLKVSGYGFSKILPENYEELIIISLPALIGSSTNYSEVNVYAYK